MHHVHLFASSHRFASWDALRAHIDPRYTPEPSSLCYLGCLRFELPGTRLVKEVLHNPKPMSLAKR